MRQLAADGAPLPDPASAALSTLCRNLRSLSLVACPSLSGKGIAFLSKGCPRLTELALGGGGGGRASWSEKDLLPLAPRLRSLRLARRPALRDAELRELLSKSSRLKKFVLSAAPRVTDEGLTPEFRGGGGGGGGEAGTEEAEKEEGAEAEAEVKATTTTTTTATKKKKKKKTPPNQPFLPSLVSLSIPCCTGIRGHALPLLTALTSLELLGCSGVTARAAATAALSLTKLKELVLPPGVKASEIPVGAAGSHLVTLAVFH